MTRGKNSVLMNLRGKMRVNQKGFAHVLVMLLLVAGLAAGVYLVGQQTNLLPKAYEQKTLSPPITPTPIPTSTPTPTVCTACNADIDGNGYVTIIDFSKLRSCFNQPPTGSCQRADITGDGRIDLADFGCLRGQFGKQCVQPTPTPIPSAKRVFVTSTTYNGNLGGLSGADSKCQTRANAVNLGGTWKAWLSISPSDYPTSVAARFTHNSGPYQLLNGVTIANNWVDLTDGTLQNPINLTEFRTTPNYMSCVWTSTDIQGNFLPIQGNLTACNNYTSADLNYSWCGRNGSTDSNWTKWSTDRCDQQHPLYCFEQ